MSTALEVVRGSEMERAAVVSNILVNIKKTTRDNFFVTCELLLEAYEGEYHKHYGYNKFGEWVEASEFDLGSRTAYYLVSIGKKARELGLSQEELRNIPISSLKEILSLETATHEGDIRALLGQAEEMTTEEVKAKVKGLKSASGEELYTHLNLKIPALVKETIEEAFELCRRMYGSTVNEFNEVVDISDGKCLEYIAAAFLMDPNNHNIESGSIIEAEIEDEVITT